MTSCSIAVSGAARPILWMNAGFADDPDYSKNNFIGDGKLVGAEPLAPLAQLVSATPGRGRVLAFTDSTLFSNFSIYFPGVRELAFGGVEWLLCAETFRPGAGWPRASGRSCCWPVRGSCAVTEPPSVPRSCWGPARASVRPTSRAAGCWSPGPGSRAARRRVRRVGLRRACPIWHQAHEEMPDEFWGLYLAFQRSGSPMRVALDPGDLFRGRQSVLVWPKEPLPSGLAERAREFVESGGVLYVFEDRLTGASSADRILEPFGLRMDAPCAGRRLSGQVGGLEGIELRHSVTVLGGEPLLLDTRDDQLIARARYGRGRVVAVGLAEDLSSASMATSSEPRGRRGQELLRLLYLAIDAAGNGVAPARVPLAAL